MKKINWFQSLSFKFYVVVLVFVGFIFSVSVFSWRSLLEVVGVQQVIVNKNIPELILATSIVQQSERLIQSAPHLITSSSETELQELQKEIEKGNRILKNLLNEFERSSVSKNSLGIQKLIRNMTNNLEKIESSVSEKRKWMNQLSDLSNRMTQLSRLIHKTLVIKIDNQTFDLAIRSNTVQSQKIKEKKNIQLQDILLYRRLLDLQSQTNISVNLLREVIDLSHSDLLQPARERFVAAISSCQKTLNTFPEKYKELKDNINRIYQIGLLSKDSIFKLKKKILFINKQQKKYLSQNKHIANQFSETIKKMNLNIQKDGNQMAKLFDQSLKKNQTVLLSVNLFSLFGSLILVFFLITPLIRRLTYLSSTMRKMSEGDLNQEVHRRGKDEVREMAEALEVFRRHALEVQRLNLVEKLAEEVKEKNKTLEKTINDLQKTRNQLVIQEKLASLGQLTSGIAHEIKNPLNFINNFSALSRELVSELESELKKELSSQSHQEVWGFIQSLLQDIQSNMEKIQDHGNRANDIINGMLQHSRGTSGQLEQVDLNRYMDTYSNLAFHSKRSVDSSFNVSFKKDYDSELQPIQTIPQDVSRMILNLITNACDAIDEKKKQIKDSSYEGIIELRTKRKDQTVEITFRDNGIGMSKEVKEKIFNPFFTTKDTGKGTGLGLSLVHDTVVKQGGQMTVQSEKNTFTQFTITLPIDQK